MATSDAQDNRVLIDVDHDKRIATITLNNPKQRNSYDAAMRDAIARCLDEVAEDDDLTVVLLRGAGGVFSTGADMNNAYGWYGERGAKSRPSQRRRLTVDRKSFGFYHNLVGFPKVTVGEISGYALGGGFEMALMTDISVIARDTRIGVPATRFLGPALGACTCSSTASVRSPPGACCSPATSSRRVRSSTSASSPTPAIPSRCRRAPGVGRRRRRRCRPTESSSPRKRSGCATSTSMSRNQSRCSGARSALQFLLLL